MLMIQKIVEQLNVEAFEFQNPNIPNLGKMKFSRCDCTEKQIPAPEKSKYFFIDDVDQETALHCIPENEYKCRFDQN